MIKPLTLYVLMECKVYGEAPPMTPAIDESLNWLIMEDLVEFDAETDMGVNVTPKGEEWITKMQELPVPGSDWEQQKGRIIRIPVNTSGVMSIRMPGWKENS